ncbi:Sugar phosphate isomerase/epimerase [Treponema bryantii]|uniref:Sugar phosphate isomerase/epimerase n=1 Tax=Treponema bryantii TaxID=163 RepID=A0A1H8ZUV7_9SPIR|nr:TIM barrel protein [Treponema bryantii]SEP68266.1 Sugar phosphate isomerase/epimerase [Treponema bryantii]
MYLGISSSLSHTTPEDWAAKHKSLGLKTVNFPVDCTAGEEKIMAYKNAADAAGLTIAEVGIWRNTLAADLSERQHWIDYAVEQLKMADRIGARCCVNVVGTPYGPRWDGGYRENFSEELWTMAVRMIQEIIDRAAPARTKFSIESMPWMIPSSPDEYLRLMEEVDRPAFGAHLDVVNMITSPDRYFFNDSFLEECFTKLKGRICSCHLKDINLKQEYTFQLEECASGKGTLDLEFYARLASAEDPQMPMIIEHLTTDEEYLESVKYVRERLGC